MVQRDAPPAGGRLEKRSLSSKSGVPFLIGRLLSLLCAVVVGKQETGGPEATLVQFWSRERLEV